MLEVGNEADVRSQTQSIIADLDTSGRRPRAEECEVPLVLKPGEWLLLRGSRKPAVLLRAKEFSFTYVSLCVFSTFTQVPKEAGREVGLPGARVIGSCKLFNMDDWKLSLDPLEEPQTVLTSESFLWPRKCLNFRLGNVSRDKGLSLS